MLRRWFILSSTVALLTGCQAEHRTVARSSEPIAIESLTNQTVVYSCPKCGMDYDRAGTCPMDDAALVKTAVAYICPADGDPVSSAGKCPRCETNAKVVKTPIADAAPQRSTPSGS